MRPSSLPPASPLPPPRQRLPYASARRWASLQRRNPPQTASLPILPSVAPLSVPFSSNSPVFLSLIDLWAIAASPSVLPDVGRSAWPSCRRALTSVSPSLACSCLRMPERGRPAPSSSEPVLHRLCRCLVPCDANKNSCCWPPTSPGCH